MDCGPASLRMVAKYYGKDYSLQYLREQSYIDREGVSLKGIIEAAEHIGLRSLPVKLPFDGKSQGQAFLVDAPLPCIVHWRQNHFLVVYKISKKYVWVADPAAGKFKLDHETFRQNWQGDGEYGIGLLLEPTPAFYDKGQEGRHSMNYLFLATYLRPYRRYFAQLLLGLLLGSVFQLIFPFLTQAIVDTGIQNQNRQRARRCPYRSQSVATPGVRFCRAPFSSQRVGSLFVQRDFSAVRRIFALLLHSIHIDRP